MEKALRQEGLQEDDIQRILKQLDPLLKQIEHLTQELGHTLATITVNLKRKHQQAS